MQRWLKQQGLPVIVSGLHEGIELPSINLDYYGSGRHAAGVILGRGHRRAAVLRSNRGVPSVHIGASELARGFCDVFAVSPRAGREPIVVAHNGDTNTVCRILNRLIDLPDPPTALLIGDSATFLIAVTHLAQRRVKIPEEMSVIVAEDEPYFSRILPAPAHYEWPLDSFLQHWLRLFRKLRQGGLGTDTCIRVVPRFIAGGTLASRRS
jgi:DNA-binding LacI/PurR family transcriptional regulator